MSGGCLQILLACALATTVFSEDRPKVWHVVWTGGQSNSVGTNSQRSGYPTWPTSPRIQNYVQANSSFIPAVVPLQGEYNVGFSQVRTTSSTQRDTKRERERERDRERETHTLTMPSYSHQHPTPNRTPQTFANLLLPTIPHDHGIVLLNTGVGGTGFIDGRWVVPGGDLTINAIKQVTALAAALPAKLGGTYSFHSMLWHQGECDAGDNRVKTEFQSTYVDRRRRVHMRVV